MKLRRNIRANIREKREVRSSLVTTNKPFKPLTTSIKRSYGRDNSGKITVRHKHSGHKQSYRIIGHKRQRLFMESIAKVLSIEYDPNRSSLISLIQYDNKKHEYIHHIKNLKVGDTVICSEKKVAINPGNRTKLINIPVGTSVCCIEEHPGRGWCVCLSAGNFASIMDVTKDYATLSLPSGEVKRFNSDCMATIGKISNEKHKNFFMYKAGNSYHRGIRPTVRGVAMNPVAHPHGGGEGRGGTKRPPVSYTCKLAKGGKTANTKRASRSRIVRRAKRK